MMKNLNLLLFGLLVFLSTSLSGQSIPYDQEYELAKSQFVGSEYARAAQRFKNLLTRDPANKKAAYTAYYYGLSTYYLDDLESAKNIFQELTKTRKDWDKLPEAQLWLAKIYFELNNPVQAVYYSELALRNPQLKPAVDELKKASYVNLDSVALQSILRNNQEDTLAAHYLALWQVRTPSKWQNTSLLDSLIRSYQLDSSALELTAPADIFKDQYRVAILLPLFTERLWHSGIYLQKSLAVDIYEGIQMALEEFDSTEIKVEVFDTKRDSTITSNIIASGQLQDADAIIGPLYPEPISQISIYAKTQKINFLNPVSTNPDIIADNPYGFLLRTGAHSIGEIVADYTRNRIDTGAFAIYYGPRKTDSLTAFNYATQVRQDSFYLAIRQRTSTAEARQIFDSLTSSVQVVDSVKLQEMIEAEEDLRFKPLMDSLLLKVDSLGHIFVASDNQAIASEVMAAVAYRGDTSQLIGVGNWFSVPNAGLDLLESLNVWLAMQQFENMLSNENLEIGARYRKKYLNKPSKYVYYGYYAMKFIGSSLLSYGVYFQNGYRTKGNLDPDFDYRRSRDNRGLTLFRLQDGHPVPVRKQQLLPADE